MRKLLSLLTVLTLTVPVPLNAIACGSKANPAPDVDDTDYSTLKQTAEEKIQTEFANLVNDGSMLRTEDNLTDGGAIMTYLQSIKSQGETPITDSTTINAFLKFLETQVLNISNTLVTKYPELKPLFNGINPNERLKIKLDDLNKIFTNKVFKWEGNDFDLQGFDAKDPKYGVTDWFHLTANLKLNLTCLDENAKPSTNEITQSYDMYFANKGANLNDAVNAITNNVKEKVNNIGVIKLEYPQWNDSFANQKDDVLTKINKELMKNAELKNIKNLEINTNAIPNPYGNDYNYMNNYGTTRDDNNDKFPLTLPNSQSFIKNSTDFEKAWNPIIANRETNFVNRLNTWETTNNLTITNKDNVFVFSAYQTTNWKISGLEIKTLSVPYYITSTNTTRKNNTNKSLEILEKLFVGTDALFQYGKNYIFKEWYNFTVKLNPDTYDEFIKDNVPIKKVYEYISEQTNNFGKDKKFIKSTDKVEWTANDTEWLDGSIKNALEKGQSARNFRLVINGNAFAMSLNAHGYTDFNISRTDTNVWPTT